MAHKIPAAQAAEDAGYSSIQECLEATLFGTAHCPACCSEGCETEIDGTCQHGFPSIAMEQGLV